MTHTHAPTILLVDDEPDFLEAARVTLESAGYHVITASDAHAGLEAARKSPVSLAVLDVNLPDGDGYGLCREMRTQSEGADFPVLFLSVRREMRDILWGIAAGARDFLTKPIGRQELLAAVDRTLAA
jgi:DNA-binding response OmpR family regulator